MTRDGRDDPGQRSPWASGVVLLLGFLLLTAGPVLIGLDHFPSKSIDMDRNHIPVIEAFADQWPSPDLRDYDSATTPGMHLLLAGLVEGFGATETVLQLCTCLFGTLLIGSAWWFGTRVAGGWISAACMLPLALSPYVLGNAIWVMTDDLSLALIVVSIGMAIFIRPTMGASTISGAAMILSVMVRQINVWPTAIALATTLLGRPAIRRRLPFRDRLDDRTTLLPSLTLGVGVAGAFSVLGGFALAWGGLVPPSFQPGGSGAMTHSGGINLAVAPYVLTLFGVYALPSMMVLLPIWREDSDIRRSGMWGALVGLAIGITLESIPGAEHGRTGGWLWTLADRLPVLASRSSLLLPGSVLGGLTAGLLLGLVSSAGRTRAGWLMIGFAASFLAAYTANAQAFQRYFDPMVLLAIGWTMLLASGAVSAGGILTPLRIASAGIAAAAMQAVFAIATVYLKLGFAPFES